MQGLRPKQLARIGIFYLEEAVLDVLFEAGPLSATSISKRLGVFRGEGHYGYLVYNVLQKLEAERRVGRCRSVRGGWQLTEKEIEQRSDD